MRVGRFWQRLDGALNARIGAACPPLKDCTIPTNAAWAAMVVVVRLENLDLIRAAFGRAAALEASEAFWCALHGWAASTSAIAVQPLAQSIDEYCFVLRSASEAGAGSSDLLRMKLSSWLQEVGCQAFSAAGSVVHLALSCGAVDAGPRSDERDVLHALIIEARDGLRRAAGLRISHFSCAEWVRRDMAVAAAHFAELASGELQFAWEPVRAIDDDALLYIRAVAAVPGVSGEVVDREAGYRALERLQLVAAFDQVQVQRAIEQAARSGGRSICVTVSAVSFQNSAWWERVLLQLGAQGSLAERLLIAVDCVQFPLGATGAVELADRLRRLGCKIVLPGFGAGHAAFAGLLALQPDIITLDPFLLRIAGRGGRDRVLLNQVVSLAGVLAPLVVAEGVDTPSAAEIVLRAGVVWGCGDYAGVPTWRGPEAHAGRTARIPPFQWSDVQVEWAR